MPKGRQEGLLGQWGGSLSSAMDKGRLLINSFIHSVSHSLTTAWFTDCA